jgi:hypothetical protein
MWSRTVRNALEARSVADNDSDSDRSDASTPTSSPTRQPDAFKPKKDADSTRSAEAVGPSQPEVRPSLLTRLPLHTAAEEEEEEIPSQRAPLQRAAVSPGRFAEGTCRGDIIAFCDCRRRQMLSPLWEVLRKLRMCLPGRDALADGGKDAWALPFGARIFTPG